MHERKKRGNKWKNREEEKFISVKITESQKKRKFSREIA